MYMYIIYTSVDEVPESPHVGPTNVGSLPFNNSNLSMDRVGWEHKKGNLRGELTPKKKASTVNVPKETNSGM